MDEVYRAEGRIKEVAYVNAHKAPELLAAFNIAYLDINDHLTKLELALNEAQKVANKRRSIVILDEVPKILALKGLASTRSPGGSEDQRNAILDQDELYLTALERVQIVKAMQSLLEGKQKAIEMAFTSVKKILGGEPSWKDNGLASKSHRFSAGAEEQKLEAGQTLGCSSHPAFGVATVK